MLTGSETTGAEVGWWYWKHAHSIHLSKRDCCNNGGTRSSTCSHFASHGLRSRCSEVRRQSAGSLTPAGLVRNKVGFLTTKIGSIPGSSCSFSRLERPLRYTSGGSMGVSVYGKMGTSSVLDWKTCRTVVSTSVVGCTKSANCFEPRSSGSKRLINIQAFFQARGFVKPFVWMSAAIFAVISYMRTKWSLLKCSCNDVIEIPWVLSKCRIVGFLPERTTPITPWLSSWNNNLGDESVSVSQILSAGRPIVRRVTSAATISASGVEWLTHPWRLLPPANGNRVRFPWICIWEPEVDLNDCAHPAKSASAYKAMDRSFMSFLTHPIISSLR